MVTKRGLIEANNNETEIHLAWIPGYSGIRENQIADHLANLAKNLTIPMNILQEKENLLPKIKKNIK